MPEPVETRASPDPVPQPEVATGTLRPRQRGLRGALAGVAVDVSPLRTSREFRLLFIGQGISSAGSMLTYVAVPYQAYALSGSSLVVSLVSLAELAPILLMSFIGGALADTVDRRRMVRITEGALCVVILGLLVNAALPHPHLGVLLAGAVLAAGVDALQRPSLDALVPRTVSHAELPAASALEAMRGTMGRVAGPTLAGVLIATIGLPLTFAVDVASFAASLTALSLMGAVPPPVGAARFSGRAMVTGLQYARRRQDLLGSYLVDMNAMFFGMPMALFPQVAAGFGGPAALGLLYTAPSVGSLLVTLTSGWTAAVRRHGRAIGLAAAAWGVAIAGFGLAPTLWLALPALAAAGAADMVSGLFRMTLWNQTIPDAVRGRLAGIEMISYTSGPALGNLESGVVGALAGVRASVVSGGVLCVAGTVALCALLPRFWGYRSEPCPAS